MWIGQPPRTATIYIAHHHDGPWYWNGIWWRSPWRRCRDCILYYSLVRNKTHSSNWLIQRMLRKRYTKKCPKMRCIYNSALTCVLETLTPYICTVPTFIIWPIYIHSIYKTRVNFIILSIPYWIHKLNSMAFKMGSLYMAGGSTRAHDPYICIRPLKFIYV